MTTKNMKRKGASQQIEFFDLLKSQNEEMSAAYSKIEAMERNRVSRAVPDLLSAFDEKKQTSTRGTVK